MVSVLFFFFFFFFFFCKKKSIQMRQQKNCRVQIYCCVSFRSIKVNGERLDLLANKKTLNKCALSCSPLNSPSGFCLGGIASPSARRTALYLLISFFFQTPHSLSIFLYFLFFLVFLHNKSVGKGRQALFCFLPWFRIIIRPIVLQYFFSTFLFPSNNPTILYELHNLTVAVKLVKKLIKTGRCQFEKKN